LGGGNRGTCVYEFKKKEEPAGTAVLYYQERNGMTSHIGRIPITRKDFRRRAGGGRGARFASPKSRSEGVNFEGGLNLRP